MKKEDFEPARIISRPGTQSDQDKNSDPISPESASLKSSEAGSTVGNAGGQGGSFQKTQTTPLMGILNQVTGVVAPGTSSPSSLYTMSKQGVLDAFRGRTIHEAAQDIQLIVVAALSNTLMFIGYYLLAVFFDNDPNKALAKNPKKQTSLNELASQKSMPFTRQRLAECVRSAALDMELRKMGLHLDSLTFYHYAEISNLPRLEDQIALAQEVEAKKLTPGEVLDRVQKFLGKSSSEDKRLGKAVMKNVGDLLRLATDAQTQDFLKDKDRVKEAFGPTETTALLGSIRTLKKKMPASEALFKDLEPTLVELLVEYTREDEVVEIQGEGHSTS
jgi:hypothetical protein